MEKDYIAISSAPAEESCAQFGSPGFGEQMQAECRAFRRQLLRMFPIPAGADAEVVIRSNRYECDSYWEVGVEYGDQAGLEYALRVEHGTPLNWDAEAREELARFEASRRARDSGEWPSPARSAP